MKQIFIVCVLLALAVPLGAKDKDKSKGGGDVSQAITDMESKWASASKAGDADAIAAMLADDAVILDSDGTSHTKAEVVDRVKKAKWDTNEVSDMKVTTHGNTAVVTGVWTGKGTDASGKAVDTKERWTDTWVKMPNGKWQCVASTSATMKM